MFEQYPILIGTIVHPGRSFECYMVKDPEAHMPSEQRAFVTPSQAYTTSTPDQHSLHPGEQVTHTVE